MAQRRVRIATILAKAETTYNTDSSPDGTNAVRVYELNVNPNALIRMIEQPEHRATIDQLPRIYSGAMCEITFSFPLKGSGTAGTAPEIDPLLQCAGLEDTIVAATSVTYDPSTNPTLPGSATLIVNWDGVQQKITGCRATSFELSATAANGLVATMTLLGHKSGVFTDTSMPSLTFDDTQRIPFYNASSFAVGSWTPSGVIDFSVNLGLEAGTYDDAVAADGYGEVVIGSRAATGRMVVPLPTVAAKNLYSDLTSNVEATLDTGVIGSAGNQIQITAPALQFLDLPLGTADRIRTVEIAFSLNSSSGDDEIAIAFT